MLIQSDRRVTLFAVLQQCGTTVEDIVLYPYTWKYFSYKARRNEKSTSSDAQILICWSRPGRFVLSDFISTEGTSVVLNTIFHKCLFFEFLKDIQKG